MPSYFVTTRVDELSQGRGHALRPEHDEKRLTIRGSLLEGRLQLGRATRKGDDLLTETSIMSSMKHVIEAIGNVGAIVFSAVLVRKFAGHVRDRAGARRFLRVYGRR